MLSKEAKKWLVRTSIVRPFPDSNATFNHVNVGHLEKLWDGKRNRRLAWNASNSLVLEPDRGMSYTPKEEEDVGSSEFASTPQHSTQQTPT